MCFQFWQGLNKDDVKSDFFGLWKFWKRYKEKKVEEWLCFKTRSSKYSLGQFLQSYVDIYRVRLKNRRNLARKSLPHSQTK